MPNDALSQLDAADTLERDLKWTVLTLQGDAERVGDR
jgi:hypothetical protein